MRLFNIINIINILYDLTFKLLIIVFCSLRYIDNKKEYYIYIVKCNNQN